MPDPVLVRGTGDPLYTLVNPVDDALMGITHVLRGEDLLPSTPRQIALYEALIAIGRAEIVPQFGHLPFVTGEGNRKLSKRDPQSNLFQYRDDGFITEGMVNYLALLGWSLGDDRDIFTPAELVAAFRRHTGSPATRPGSTGRRPRRSTVRTCGCWPPTTSPTGCWTTCVDPRGLPAEPSAEQTGAGHARRRHWCRSGPRCCPRRRR